MSPIEPVGIRASGFGWTHAGRAAAALSEVNLEIAPGERVLLCGNSGSGKSTLLAAFAGVLGGDDEGTARGQLLLGSAPAHSATVPVGLVLQDPDSQVIAARVGDDVAFGCENLGLPREEIWERVHNAMDLVGLDLPLDFPTAHLSGGQKQRLALAGVVAMGAGVILLDEPTANLDPQGTQEVVEAVAATVEAIGATLVVVEHKYDLWDGVLSRAVVLDNGRVIDDGFFGEIVQQRTITGLPAARPVELEKGVTVGTGAALGKGAALWSRDLRCRFGPPRTAAIVEGASTVITGANGAGKTTWLLTMAGLLRPVRGEIGVADSIRNGLKGDPYSWKSRQLAHRIGFVFQNPEHQFLARTVREELEIAPKVMEEKVPAARIDSLVERLRLGHLLGANPFTLSGGEKRRLSVATALVAAPRVVLFDEPTFGQDPETFVELIRLLRELCDDGVTIASITHDELFIGSLGDSHIHFDAGEG